jgi:hypothetical protein
VRETGCKSLETITPATASRGPGRISATVVG